MSGNKNNIFAKCICLMLTAVLLLSGCAQHKKYHKQTKYHEEIQELEEYVLEQLGDYICFDICREDEKQNRVDISICLIYEFTYDEQKVEEYPIMKLMEDTRLLINDFLSGYPSYFGEGTIVDVVFIYPSDGSPMAGGIDLTLGEWMNMPDKQDGYLLCAVNYYEYLNEELLNGKQIRKIYLDKYGEDGLDRIINIIEKLPELEEVVVRSSLADEVSSRYPDLTVIDR